MNEFYEREELVRRLMGIKQNTIIKTHRVIKNALIITMIAVGLMVAMFKRNLASLLYFVMLVMVIKQGYYSVQKLKDSAEIENMDVKKEKVVKILKMNLIAIIFVMMWESLMMIEYIDTPLI
jgi:purine-cytosine permease-like protein